MHRRSTRFLENSLSTEMLADCAGKKRQNEMKEDCQTSRILQGRSSLINLSTANRFYHKKKRKNGFKGQDTGTEVKGEPQRRGQNDLHRPKVEVDSVFRGSERGLRYRELLLVLTA